MGKSTAWAPVNSTLARVMSKWVLLGTASSGKTPPRAKKQVCTMVLMRCLKPKARNFGACGLPGFRRGAGARRALPGFVTSQPPNDDGCLLLRLAHFGALASHGLDLRVFGCARLREPCDLPVFLLTGSVEPRQVRLLVRD